MNVEYSDKLIWKSDAAGKISLLRRLVDPVSGRVTVYFNAEKVFNEEDHPRDDKGQWTDAGGNGGSGESASGDENFSIPHEANFPRVGSHVDGLKVLNDVPNTSSISAGFNEGEYEELPGIREVPFSVFQAAGKPVTSDRNKRLAEEIKQSGEIKPLIVVVEKYNLKEGPYVMEGSHRFDALQILEKKSFPAMVIVDFVTGKDKTKAYNEEDHPRDDKGQWTDAGGDVGGGSSESNSDSGSGAKTAPHNEWKSIPTEANHSYHATSEENAIAIAESGSLKPHGPSYGTDQDSWPDGSTEMRSYFIDEPGKAYSFAPAEGKPVLLKIYHDAVKLKKESTGDLYSTKPIKASDLQIALTGGKWVPLLSWIKSLKE